MSKTLSDLPTDLHHLILSHDEEKIELKKENEKLKKIIDDFAKYTSLSTSQQTRRGRYIYFGEDVSLFGPPSETPNIRVLGDTLFAKIKALDPTIDRNNYIISTKDDIESEIIGTESIPSSDIWCIGDLRWDLSIYDGSWREHFANDN